MDFEELIQPLTKFLIHNNFTVTKKIDCFTEYTSESVIIRVAYDNFEYSFSIYVGENSNSLVELTHATVKEVFNDDSFQVQSTLTIDNLITFLKTSGKSILLGDKKTFEKLNEFSQQQSRNYTEHIIQSQNIQRADKAWMEKDYANFIKYIDNIDMNLIPKSYSKKYKIATDILRKDAE